MLLSTTTNFIITDDKNEVPFLIITHNIPSHEHFSAEIRNANAEIFTKELNLEELTKEKRNLERRK